MKIVTALAGILVLIAACSRATENETQNGGAASNPAAASELVLAKAPQEGARVTSPLSIEGTAPSNWYFEGQFQAKLIGADGAIIAEAPALPQTDWQVEGPVAFIADLGFEVSRDTPATLVLQEDMTAEGQTPREKRIALVLAR